MPYADPEKQREYQRKYQARYQQKKRAEIKARRAQWFQQRKETATMLQRVRRAVKRCEAALEALAERDRTAALVVVTVWATDPEVPLDVVAVLWRQVSHEGREKFLAALPPRTRRQWETLA